MNESELSDENLELYHYVVDEMQRRETEDDDK